MNVSKHAIEKMGYSEYQQDDSIEITFGILKAYTIRGMKFEQDCETPFSEVICFEKGCTAVMSQSLNKACKLLTGGVFVDKNEDEWLKEKKYAPPFLLICFKESKSRLLRGGYRQEIDGDLYIYDGFPEGKMEIRNWEKKSLPSIITSLTVRFSTLVKHVKFIPIERSVFGVTEDGQTTFDLRLTSNVELHASSYKNLNEINSSLLKSKELCPKLTEDTSRHIHAALNESDNLKKFLSYFLFVERYTHSTFKRLNYDDDTKKLFNIPDRIAVKGVSFFKNQLDLAKNLNQRFHWCALLKWKHINDQDIECFQEVKKVRDRVAHGEDIDESILPVERIKMLALKMLGTEEV